MRWSWVRAKNRADKATNAMVNIPLYCRHNFGPTVFVFINADALAIGNPFEEPCGDVLCGRIFEPVDVIEESVIYLLDEWGQFCINFGKILDEPSNIERSADDNLQTVVVPVQVLAFVPVRQVRQVVGRFEAIGATDACREADGIAGVAGWSFRGEIERFERLVHGIPMSLCV